MSSIKLMSPEEELAFNARVAQAIAEKTSNSCFLKSLIEETSEQIRELVAYKERHGTFENTIKYLEETRKLYVSSLRDQKYRLNSGKQKHNKRLKK